jgi:hypothetical protein
VGQTFVVLGFEDPGAKQRCYNHGDSTHLQVPLALKPRRLDDLPHDYRVCAPDKGPEVPLVPERARAPAFLLRLLLLQVRSALHLPALVGELKLFEPLVLRLVGGGVRGHHFTNDGLAATAPEIICGLEEGYEKGPM